MQTISLLKLFLLYENQGCHQLAESPIGSIGIGSLGVVYKPNGSFCYLPLSYPCTYAKNLNLE